MTFVARDKRFKFGTGLTNSKVDFWQNNAAVYARNSFSYPPFLLHHRFKHLRTVLAESLSSLFAARFF